MAIVPVGEDEERKRVQEQELMTKKKTKFNSAYQRKWVESNEKKAPWAKFAKISLGDGEPTTSFDVICLEKGLI